MMTKILKILKKSGEFQQRKDIENELQRASKRSVLNQLNTLIKFKRVQKDGQSTNVAYKISNLYHEDFEKKLYVYQNHILIGYLGYDYQKYYFAYDTDYLLLDKHTVNLQLKLGYETYIQDSCFVDFEECLPEGIDREILANKAENKTEFFLLAHNDYSNNDLIFSQKRLNFSKSLKSYSYLSQKNKILGKNIFPNILKYNIDIDEYSLFPNLALDKQNENKFIRTMSLSGYQHKLQVTISDNTLRVTKDGENATHFIKLYDIKKAYENSEYYFPHIAINEHLHMSFAKNELGFDVPLSGIFKREKDKEYHYFVKYFDRIKAYKFGRKEFATLMGLDSFNKYKTSSEKLFKTAKKTLLLKADRLRMLEYYFYSFLICHEDMHTKNISIIYDEKKNFLAPLYDIACTGFYGGLKNYESHLSINGKRTNIRYNDFLKLVLIMEIDKQDFKLSAKNILEIYIQKMPLYIKKISKLENIDFYIKDKPNAQNKKIKIKSKTTLDNIMMKHFKKRCETLKKNGWFESLEYLYEC